jgi:hypothetical protein
MYEYPFSNNTNRSYSALEIALQARIREREQALRAGEFMEMKVGSKRKNFFQVLLAALFLG